jgi:hypothetical protein
MLNPVLVKRKKSVRAPKARAATMNDQSNWILMIISPPRNAAVGSFSGGIGRPA